MCRDPVRFYTCLTRTDLQDNYTELLMGTLKIQNGAMTKRKKKNPNDAQTHVNKIFKYQIGDKLKEKNITS